MLIIRSGRNARNPQVAASENPISTTKIISIASICRLPPSWKLKLIVTHYVTWQGVKGFTCAGIMPFDTNPETV
jgi:hypothetical protein